MPAKLNVDKVRSIIKDCGFEPLFNDSDYIGNRSKLKLKCRCGNITYKTFDLIQRKETKTCSHCNDPHTGDKIGSLTVIKVIPSIISKGCKIICRCDCGRTYGPCFASKILHQNTTSCGNCKLRKNGRFTSRASLNLQKNIEEILLCKCEHNKDIGGKCFDIVCDPLKIIVEYDGYYWHRINKDMTNNEIESDKIAKIFGYKLLRIRSDGYELPTIKQLNSVINKLLTKPYNKWTITLRSWKLKEKSV